MVSKATVYYTHPLGLLQSSFEEQFPVRIAVCKSTSKNLYDEMSCCTVQDCNTPSWLVADSVNQSLFCGSLSIPNGVALAVGSV
jgi:hypothetical protein